MRQTSVWTAPIALAPTLQLRVLLLLLDPDESAAMACRLASLGCEVERGEVADSAARLAVGPRAQARPDLVLMDALDVAAQGVAVCQRLREHWLDDTGSLLVCGEAADGALVEGALAAGATDWIRPPLGEAEWVARLRLHLELAQQRRLAGDWRGRVQADPSLFSSDLLTAGLAHEVNNPNNFALLSAENANDELKRFRAHLDELLDDDADPSIRADFARRFEKIDQHLALVRDGCRLIAEVVQLARPQPGAGLETEVAVDLVDVLERSVRLVGVAYGQSVRFDMDLSHHARVRCQPGRMQQVFLNLLVNACHAIEARPPGPGLVAPGVVRVVSRLQGQDLRLGVLDNGTGMEPEVQRRLFEPLFTTKEPGRGTGLGLGICRDIVRGLGGDIEVQSELGMGTEMWLRLPALTGGGV